MRTDRLDMILILLTGALNSNLAIQYVFIL